LYHVAGGQPEYTNEDLEEDLTGNHPPELPLRSSQVGRVSDVEHQHYATTTMRTYGEPDSETFTNISSRMSEMQIRKKSKNNMKGSSDRDQYTNAYRLRTVEVEQNLDSSNISPAVTNTTENYTKNKASTDKVEENEIENEEEEQEQEQEEAEQEQEEQEQEDDEDDDDDDNDYCGDEDDNDESGDDENGDDVNRGDENDSGDEDDEDTTDKDYSNTQNSSINSEDGKNTHGTEGKSNTKTGEATLKMSKKSKTFQDSVEHGRQWKDDSKETATTGRRNGEEVSTLTTTSTSATSRSALQIELAAFLKNESPETEDPESRNVTEEGGKKDGARNTKEHRQLQEAELDTVQKLQQIRELEKRANIPQEVKLHFNFTIISFIPESSTKIK
jgi:hypothetical protein